MSAQAGKAKNAATERRHRRHPRFRCNFPVGATFLSGGGEYKRHEAHCKDLSEAGIGMLIATELTVGEVASLNFCLPGTKQSWEVRAVLRHRRGYHYGFEFLSLPRELEDIFKDFFRNLEQLD